MGEQSGSDPAAMRNRLKDVAKSLHDKDLSEIPVHNVSLSGAEVEEIPEIDQADVSAPLPTRRQK